ncbi:MAG: hypothetical protein JWN29_4187 [Acidimicrobiales bacterium]|nr:hypothetical protein [Acidimicrobiales bacterium]
MADLAVGFAAHLRLRGLVVPPDTVVGYAKALDALGLADRDGVYWAGRSTLVRRPEDTPAYDAAFADFWDGQAAFIHRSHSSLERRIVAVDLPQEEGDGEGEGEADEVLRWSAVEVLRHKDLALLTPEERDEADRLIDALRLAGPRRRSRRRRRSHRGALDLRRTVATALRAGGEPVHLAHQAPGERRRRVVLLLDVSGSMADYARGLLRFAHAAVSARDAVEVFTLGTRLTRLTPMLATHDADAALAAATAAVPDYEGGTRLGDTIGEFTERYGVRGMARGAVVVILSDGWDRGDPAVLGEHVARLSRVAHRLVWVNPLKASPGYAPLAGGMAAALPWVDEFVEGHAVASLESLARLLSNQVTDRRAG